MGSFWKYSDLNQGMILMLIRIVAPEEEQEGGFLELRAFQAVGMVPTEMAPYPAYEAWPQKEHITLVPVSL